MVERVGDVAGGVGQPAVEELREHPVEETETAADSHGRQQVRRQGPHRHPAPFAEEREPGQLQAHGKEGPDGREGEQQLRPEEVFLAGGADDHGLADEAVEEGSARNRERRDAVHRDREAHLPGDPSQVREPPQTGGLDGRSRAHEQERLVEDVGERVRSGAVEGKLGADAHRRHHVSHLAHDVVGEEASDVVLDDREDDSVERHRDAERHQDFGPGKEPQEGIDGGLGGEGREEHRSGRGRFRIGVGQPGVEGRDRGVDGHPAEDQPERRRARNQPPQQRLAPAGQMEGDPDKEKGAAGGVDEQVAHSRPPGAGGPGLPDQRQGGEGHRLPEDEEGDPVSRQHRGDGGTGVEQRRRRFAGAHPVGSVQEPEERHDGEDQCEEQAQPVRVEPDEPESGEVRFQRALHAVHQGQQRPHRDGDADRQPGDEPPADEDPEDPEQEPDGGMQEHRAHEALLPPS